MTAYDDLATPAQMQADCRLAGQNLHLARAVVAVAKPAPSIAFEDFPREIFKREITISQAAQRLANALELHLD
ncbi:hypothetical protein [Nocardioides sp.]|uniref:hypothetical protein n=1 Tax=Nocardioides sp. TaxID=35761 RepID=UPI003566D284